MGTILNPNQDNSFIRLFNARNSNLFVDKTDFIRATNSFVNNPHSKFVAMSRGRGFGKSIMADMLATYYSKGYAGRRIFQELKIGQSGADGGGGRRTAPGGDSEPRQAAGACAGPTRASGGDGLEYLNRFDVIYVDMHSIEALYRDHMRYADLIDGVDNILDFMEYAIVRELREDERFAPILEKKRIGNSQLFSALTALKEKTGVKFVLIMDDWDLIYRRCRDDLALQQKFTALLRGLFKSNAGYACFALAYLTGIMPIVKEASESGLNNVYDISMLQPRKYGRYFGFTEEEFDEIAASPSCREKFEKRNAGRCGYSYSRHIQDIKSWRDCYSVNGAHVYNPRSIVWALGDGNGKDWGRNCFGYEATRPLAMALPEVSEDIARLLKGEKVAFCDMFFWTSLNSVRRRDDVFCLLTCLGYFSCDDGGSGQRIAYIPNPEMREALELLVEEAKRFRAESIEAKPS
ncbi:MAG: AAA family ATPase [Succinivibrionaceae bacterium]|nr:AAA family ATPase [Succinivibrionaceae bacterium]